MTTNYERVVEALNNGALVSDELAARTGLSRRSVGQILGAMARRGEVEQYARDGAWGLVMGGTVAEPRPEAELQVLDVEPAIEAQFAVWNDGSVCIDKNGTQLALTADEVRAMWAHLARFMR